MSGKRAREAPHKTSNCFVRGFCLHKNVAGCGKTAQGWNENNPFKNNFPMADKLLQNFSKKQLTTPGCADIINHVVRHGTNIWGISSAGSPVGIKTHPQSDGPATINSQQKTPSKRFASWILWGISSAGRALAWHARGHRFDPGILHQKDTAQFVRCLSFFALLLVQPDAVDAVK